MQQRISLVSLSVRDLSRSRAFYETLGWARSGAYEGVAFFQTGCMLLGLYPRDALAEDTGVAEGSGFVPVSLAQNVASREAVDAAQRGRPQPRRHRPPHRCAGSRDGSMKRGKLGEGIDHTPLYAREPHRAPRALAVA